MPNKRKCNRSHPWAKVHFSHGLVFGEQISRRGQRWSNTNHDINLQLKFEFSNVQPQSLPRRRVLAKFHLLHEPSLQSLWTSVYSQQSTNGLEERITWEEATWKKVTGLQIAIVEELSVCGTAGEHSKQKSFWREEHLYMALFAHSLELQPLVKRCIKFTDVEIERGAFTLHRTLANHNMLPINEPISLWPRGCSETESPIGQRLKNRSKP